MQGSPSLSPCAFQSCWIKLAPVSPTSCLFPTITLEASPLPRHSLPGSPQPARRESRTMGFGPPHSCAARAPPTPVRAFVPTAGKAAKKLPPGAHSPSHLPSEPPLPAGAAAPAPGPRPRPAFLLPAPAGHSRLAVRSQRAPPRPVQLPPPLRPQPSAAQPAATNSAAGEAASLGRPPGARSGRHPLLLGDRRRLLTWPWCGPRSAAREGRRAPAPRHTVGPPSGCSGGLRAAGSRTPNRFETTAEDTQGVRATEVATYPAPRRVAVAAFRAAGRAWLFAPSLGTASQSYVHSRAAGTSVPGFFFMSRKKGGRVYVLG
uniref:basic proline-rich protein-like n=1 Tax=Callithrix jacchus TaxID=9483 RepID=UPI0023DCED79|nr:basic proline-rich protein-like [Callithrix jacchus]